MAKKKEEAFNYPAELRTLKERGPERLYLLWGPEDYLREQYLFQLKKICLPEGEDDFSYKRIDGPALDANAFQQAVDAMPFMTEHTLIELRDVDINKLADADACMKTISDIPDYCTIVFVQNAEYEPDGRLRFVKTLRSEGKELKFTQQSQGMLTDWIVRRFAAAGKRIDLSAAQRLIFISGDLMSRLIPEIEKIAAYAKGRGGGFRDDRAHGAEEGQFRAQCSLRTAGGQKQRAHHDAGRSRKADAAAVCGASCPGKESGHEVRHGGLLHEI